LGLCLRYQLYSRVLLLIFIWKREKEVCGTAKGVSQRLARKVFMAGKRWMSAEFAMSILDYITPIWGSN
jgi:hypothetical protein